MTDLPENVRSVADQLERVAGSYLKSVVRAPRGTCSVCNTPVGANRQLCIPCGGHAGTGLPLADRVGSLVYAVKPDSQTYLLVYNYKSVSAGPSHEREMMALLALGLRGHIHCPGNLSGSPVSAWCVVPSTKGRVKLHEMVAKLAKPESVEVRVRYAGNGQHDRTLRPDYWQVSFDGDVPKHVLVIDDSWVTGSNAQSVATALKTAGVATVSVFTVANVLNSDWEPNVAFIKSHLSGPAFYKNRCPWTGGNCP